MQEQLALLREVDGFKPPKHDRSSASFSATVYEDADVAGAVGHRTRVVVRDYKVRRPARSAAASRSPTLAISAAGPAARCAAFVPRLRSAAAATRSSARHCYYAGLNGAGRERRRG